MLPGIGWAAGRPGMKHQKPIKHMKLSQSHIITAGQWAMAAASGLAAVAASAQTFSYSSRDLVAEFRRTGSSDLTIDLGSIDTFTALSTGQTISLSSRYDISTQLLATFSNLDSLTFSVIGTHKFGLVNATEPQYTTWLTSPRTDPAIQTTPPNRYATSATQGLQSAVGGILGDGGTKGALVYASSASYPPSSSTAIASTRPIHINRFMVCSLRPVSNRDDQLDHLDDEAADSDSNSQESHD